MTNLNFDLEKNHKSPLYKQLIEHLKNQILQGDLTAGSKLPSSRNLAKSLKLSRIVILTAYEQLIAEGYLTAASGAGTFVSDNVPYPQETNHDQYLGPKWFIPPSSKPSDIIPKYDFSLGRPATQILPQDDWKRSWRTTLALKLPSEMPEIQGIEFLRSEIAEYLRRSRGIKCSAHDIIITTGSADAISMIASVTAPYKPTVHFENPGFTLASKIFEETGHKLNAINLDQQGLMTRELPSRTSHPHMVFCTPSHQFPLGFRLSLERRCALLNWAQENDALILEDDYDSEFQYGAMPLPTLKSQETTGQVIYISSFSKSISPALRLGYLIAPKNIKQAIIKNNANRHLQPSYLLQYALANFIKEGSLERHISRCRRHYFKLNSRMKDYLTDLPKNVEIQGLESGLHVSLFFKTQPIELLTSLRNRGIKTIPFPQEQTTYQHHWHGFSLGYSHFEINHLTKALKILRSEIDRFYPS